jgi:hypothetical protein
VGESLSQLAEAAVFLGIGAVILAFLSLVPILFAYVAFPFDFWPVAIAVYLLITALSTYGAWRTRHAFADSGVGGRDDLQLVFHFSYDILFNGGSQCLSAFQSLRKGLRTGRLAGRDLDQVAAIVLWVFERGRKAMTREICGALPAIEVVRILPQLQDLPGIIWLTHNREVIILSRSLRAELANLLGHVPKAAPLPEEPEPEIGGGDPIPEPEVTVNDEVLQWYRALDLPPFAPLAAVKRRYRELVKIHHPDANPHRRANKASDERIRQINIAYHNILENSARQR